MTNLSKVTVSESIEPPRQFANGRLKRIFVGEQEIRAGWGVLLFIAIFLILWALMNRALSHFVALDDNRPIPLGLAVLTESCLVLVVFLATWVMARVEKRTLLCYGYSGEHRWLRLASGVGW